MESVIRYFSGFAKFFGAFVSSFMQRCVVCDGKFADCLHKNLQTRRKGSAAKQARLGSPPLSLPDLTQLPKINQFLEKTKSFRNRYSGKHFLCRASLLPPAT